MPNPSKPKIPLKKAIQSACIVILLFLIVRHFIGRKDELSALLSIRPYDIAGIFFVTFLSYISYSINLFLVLKYFGLKDIRLGRWFKIFIISRFINFYVTQGANIYRSMKLKTEHDFPYTQSISTITFLGWFYTLTTLLFCFFIILLTDATAAVNGMSILSVLVILMAAIYIFPFLCKQILRRFCFDHKKTLWLDEKINAVFDSFQTITKDYRFFSKIILISALHFFLYGLLVYISFLALDIDVTTNQLSLFVTVLMLSKYINIVPGNIGLTELICGYLSESLGGLLSSGIIISSIIRAVDYLLILGLGISFLRFFPPKAKTNANTGS